MTNGSLKITTTDPNYINMKSGCEAMRTMIHDTMKSVGKLPQSDQAKWLAKDTLLQEVCRISIELHEFSRTHMEIVDDGTLQKF